MLHLFRSDTCNDTRREQLSVRIVSAVRFKQSSSAVQTCRHKRHWITTGLLLLSFFHSEQIYFQDERILILASRLQRNCVELATIVSDVIYTRTIIFTRQPVLKQKFCLLKSLFLIKKGFYILYTGHQW